MNNVGEKLDLAIIKLIQDFERIPHKYLTEDDVRVHLCSFLMNDFGNEERTEDGCLSIPLHTEVRWWGLDESSDRSDIVIFDVSGLSVTNSRVNDLNSSGSIPKKGYALDTPLAVIELKLRRVDGVGNSVFKGNIKADINKVTRLKKMINKSHSQDLVCRVVALDKKSNLNNFEFEAPEGVFYYSFCN